MRFSWRYPPIVGPSRCSATSFIDVSRSLATCFPLCSLYVSIDYFRIIHQHRYHNTPRRIRERWTIIQHSYVEHHIHMPFGRQVVCSAIRIQSEHTDEHRYTCPSGSFVGCCGVDPCSNGCKQGDLQPGGFPLADHGTFSDASCETGSNFWTCAPSASQTFWGYVIKYNVHQRCLITSRRCCKSNPCNNTPAATCRQGDLTPAFLGSPEKKAAYLGADEQGGKKSNGAVIGGAIGGGLGAAIIIGVLIFFFCRRRKRNQKVAHAESGANASTPMMKDGFQDNNRLSTQFGQSRKSASNVSPVLIIDVT